jgi:hypothetical protein
MCLVVILLDAAHQRSLRIDGAALIGVAEVAAGAVATIEPCRLRAAAHAAAAFSASAAWERFAHLFAHASRARRRISINCFNERSREKLDRHHPAYVLGAWRGALSQADLQRGAPELAALAVGLLVPPVDCRLRILLFGPDYVHGCLR